jgi:DNA-binding HxlR family transcriptional regulator
MTKQEVTKRLPLRKSTSTYRTHQCAVIASLKLFGTKWKPCIICYLSERPMRYNELFRAIPNISRKMLSLHLDELEEDSIIERVQYDKKLQKVEYSLSAKGISLLPLIEQIQNWGLKNISGVLSIEKMLKASKTPIKRNVFENSR